MNQRLILKNLPRPLTNDLAAETFWLCDTLGLSSGRDLDNLSSQIILKILEKPSCNSGISSEKLGDLLDISAGRVNHHIRNLSRTGILYRERRMVHLRGINLRDTIRELRRDANRIFDELEAVAGEIDSLTGISYPSEQIYSLIVQNSKSIIKKGE